jgi:hypothetical protein
MKTRDHKNEASWLVILMKDLPLIFLRKYRGVGGSFGVSHAKWVTAGERV